MFCIFYCYINYKNHFTHPYVYAHSLSQAENSGGLGGGGGEVEAGTKMRRRNKVW